MNLSVVCLHLLQGLQSIKIHSTFSTDCCFRWVEMLKSVMLFLFFIIQCHEQDKHIFRQFPYSADFLLGCNCLNLNMLSVHLLQGLYTFILNSKHWMTICKLFRMVCGCYIAIQDNDMFWTDLEWFKCPYKPCHCAPLC